jgi:hypothetical protein
VTAVPTGDPPDELPDRGPLRSSSRSREAQVHMGVEQLLARQLDAMGDTDVADVPPGRVERMACSIDFWVPTASRLSAPRVAGGLLDPCDTGIAALGDDVGGAEVMASRWRGSWRLIAMMRSAPS